MWSWNQSWNESWNQSWNQSWNETWNHSSNMSWNESWYINDWYEQQTAIVYDCFSNGSDNTSAWTCVDVPVGNHRRRRRADCSPNPWNLTGGFPTADQWDSWHNGSNMSNVSNMSVVLTAEFTFGTATADQVLNSKDMLESLAKSVFEVLGLANGSTVKVIKVNGKTVTIAAGRRLANSFTVEFSVEGLEDAAAVTKVKDVWNNDDFDSQLKANLDKQLASNANLKKSFGTIEVKKAASNTSTKGGDSRRDDSDATNPRQWLAGVMIFTAMVPILLGF